MATAPADRPAFPDLFHPATRAWLAEAFPGPTRAQLLGWPEIAAGRSTLVLAPTGSGKTLAAFLAAIDRLMFSPVPEKSARCRVLYISPLRALAVDVERNLRAPLAGIARVAERRGDTFHLPTVGLRTGDTDAAERARMARTPPDILITTPESLYLLLTSNARSILPSITLTIVDEIHTLAGTKRGAHLALSLERLEHLAGHAIQRVGLSATQRPLDEVARYLGGGVPTAAPESRNDVSTPTASGSAHAAGRSIAQAFASTADGPRSNGSDALAAIGSSSSTLDLLGSHGTTVAGASLPTEDIPSDGLVPLHPPDRGRPSEGWTPRPVSIVDAGVRKVFDLRVEVPVEDMSRLGEPLQPSLGEIPEGDTSVLRRHSIWPAIFPRLLDLIRAHRSTIVFVNSRRLAERVAGALNDLVAEQAEHQRREHNQQGVLVYQPAPLLAPVPEVARAHHGSLAREQRAEIEDLLKSGHLPAMVATSSLELGIDMGAVDLVVQIETPPSVASGLQRIGRAGHQVEGVSRGIIFPKYRGDLLATAAITRAMAEGAVEETRILRNPLDVLTQQVLAAVAVHEWRVDDLFDLVRHAAPFATLPRGQLEGVLDMLSGRYPSDELAELRPRLTWDRLRGTLRAREGLRQLVVANAGTIPDRGLYGVFLAGADDSTSVATGAATPTGRARSGRRVGELDEEMVFETREGDIVVLGASSWRVVEITRDRVLVAPAPGEPGRMPFWHGDRASRPVELGEAIGRLTRELTMLSPTVARARLIEQHGLTPGAADNLLAYLRDQHDVTDGLPDDRTIVVERTRDELGDWRLCVLSPWGGRVHAPWSLAIQAKLRAADELEAETVWTDDGIVVRLPDRGTVPDTSLLLPDPEEVEDLVVRELGGSALFAAHFREAAGRALLVPKRRPGQRAPLWMQRKRAADLLGVAARYGSFPIVLETYRECLQDVFDLPALVALARRMRGRKLRIVTVDTEAPSPFAASLLFGYVANFIYDGDAPLAERRAQALAVDQARLRELLGEAELRELLDPDVLTQVELSLQGLEPGHRARSADRVHDLLLRIGDLTLDELAARVEPPGPTVSAATGSRVSPGPSASAAVQSGLSPDAAASAVPESGLPSIPAMTGGTESGLPSGPALLGVERAGRGEAQSTHLAETHAPGLALARELVAALEAERRVIRAHLGGEERIAAVEDAGRLRDAFGVPPPPGLPAAFLEPVLTALRDVVARYARTHGPFRTADIARRYGMGEAPIAAALLDLVASGRIVEGEFRPGGTGREWCDADVLARLRQRSLAKLRRQVEPAEPAALGRLLADWQGVVTTASPRSTAGGPDRLLDVVEQLQGAQIPASTLETDVLPARLPRYRPRDLDLLCAAGEIVWAGVGALGERDGKVALYLADDVPFLHTRTGDAPSGELHERLRAYLLRHGASFFADLHQAAGGGPVGMVLDALWDLVWAGEVTNDSPAALRAYLGGASVIRTAGRAAGRRGRAGPFRSRRQAPPSAVGRWSLVLGGATAIGEPAATPSTTERLRALAEQLVARHGVLTRQAVLAEGTPGGFAALYPVLATLEEAGRLRRGYFLAGLGGAQFAQPGALDRLRALRDGLLRDDPDRLPAVVLAATDPANPYGAALPWPTPALATAPRPMRLAGAYVVLVDGMLAAFIGRAEREVVTFLPAEEPDRSAVVRALATAVARWAASTGRINLPWTAIDGAPVTRSPLAPSLYAAGFAPYGSGLRLTPRDNDDREPHGAAEDDDLDHLHRRGAV